MFTLSPFACHGLDYGGSFLCTWIIRVRDPVHSKAALLATGTPILFVSINYRLGPLGSPEGPEAME